MNLRMIVSPSSAGKFWSICRGPRKSVQVSTGTSPMLTVGDECRPVLHTRNRPRGQCAVMQISDDHAVVGGARVHSLEVSASPVNRGTATFTVNGLTVRQRLCAHE